MSDTNIPVDRTAAQETTPTLQQPPPQDRRIWWAIIWVALAVVILIGGTLLGAHLHQEYVLNRVVQQVGMIKVLTNQPWVTEAEVRESVIRLATEYNLSLNEAGTVVIEAARISHVSREQRNQIEDVIAARAKLCATAGLDCSK